MLEQLDECEAHLMLALALTCDAPARSSWTERAIRLGARMSNDRVPSTKDVEAIAARLVGLGLVVALETRQRQVVYAVRPGIALEVLALAEEKGRLALAAALTSAQRSKQVWPGAGDRAVELRVAVVRGHEHAIAVALDRRYIFGNDTEYGQWLLVALGPRPEPEIIARITDPVARKAWLGVAIREQLRALERIDEHVLEHALALDDKALRLDVARLLTVRGEGERARAISGLPKWGPEGIALLVAFWSGDYARARAIGDAAVAAMTARKEPSLPDLEGVCQLLATIVACSDAPELVASVERQLQIGFGGRGATSQPFEVLVDVLDRLHGQRSAAKWRTMPATSPRGWLDALVTLLHDTWLRPKPTGSTTVNEATSHARSVAEELRDVAATNGYPPIARELDAIARQLGGEAMPGRLAGAFQPRAQWEIALASLEAAASSVARDVDDARQSGRRELVWELELDDDAVSIAPRIRNTTGRAKKGATISLAQLLAGREAELLDERDRRVLAQVDRDDQTRWSGGPSLGVDALVELVGHPRVIGRDGQPLTIERGRPKILVQREEGHTQVDIVPDGLRDERIVVQRASADRIVVHVRPPELDRLAEVISRGSGLTVPEDGRERLGLALTRLSLAAGVELAGDLQIAAHDVAADARPLVQLGWDGDTLAVQLRVAPLGASGPAMVPGVGATAAVAAVREGEVQSLRRTVRDLDDERRRCDAVLEACPTLAGHAAGELRFSVATLAAALEVVLELDAVADRIVLAWRAGQTLDVPRRADLDGLRMRVRASGAWLDVDVALTVDEDTVLRFRELLPSIHGRFVALPRGRFVALSERLRRHLDRLTTMGAAHGQGLRTSIAVLPVVEELAEGAGEAELAPEVRTRLARLRELARSQPKVPRGFAEVLRDYQREGFVWMSRLADAGLGACLADDMGLGKTVQALALLAHRARLGPALVVCPTSVVRNWITEAERFAPGLRFHSLGVPSDRRATIEGAGPRDVIVCSYTLLATEIDGLAQRELATVVLDEAHALKNSGTKRAQAARRLRGDFRLALTGTPVENHAGELWSLFEAILPGLLGSQSQFDERFATPLARGNRERAASLRALVQPFVLRRLKSAVAAELPPRTEITLRVTPNAEERAFYEAVRRRAVELTAKIDRKKARFQILAEITRLRQAAIDPRVLDAEAGPPGAKLDVLLERLHQLVAEGHSALVFTQFLGSMAAVRERLRDEGLEYLELDGSTPAAERARRIEAFQAGEADVFLLSLRAGGTGVNLTAADYVFHLDPWWNPAVEDQASDRAHRIGQQRPVTIYRLITEGTIEEKILALHESKRQLADDLLAGLERGEALDVEQLLELLRG